jgi:DNA-binding response OmpR family regulator
VILCDYQLPVCDGSEVVRRVRHDALPVRLIMVSAVRGAERNWREWGADDFLAKPFDIDRLVSVVDRATGSDAALWTQTVNHLETEQVS